MYAYKCFPSYDDKTGKLSGHYAYVDGEFVEGGQIQMTVRTYSKDDPFCRMSFQEISGNPFGSSLTSSCQSVGAGAYMKGEISF